MYKNIVIIVFVLLLCASAGYTYQSGGFDRLWNHQEELVVVDINEPPLSEETLEEYSVGARELLLQLHEAIDIQGEHHEAVEFPWATEEGEIVLVPGMSFTVSPVTEEARAQVDTFFANYTPSLGNQADGPMGSISGYQNQMIVCRVEDQWTRTDEEQYADLTVSCGSLTSIDTSEVSRLFAAVKSATGAYFSMVAPVDIPWRDEDGTMKYIMGSEMVSAALLPEEAPALDELFTAWGWTPDMYNAGDGTMVGATAYTHDNLRCRILMSSRMIGEEGKPENAEFLTTYRLQCGMTETE